MATAQKPATPAKFLEVKTTANGLVFTFGNGTKRSFNLTEPSAKMRERAMVHGFNQKLRDATAGFSKEKDYDGAIEAVEAVWQSIMDDDWNRSGGGTAGALMEDLAAALAELRQVTLDKAMAAVEKADPKQRQAWAKNAKVAAIIAKRKADRAAAAAEAATNDDLEAIQFDADAGE